MNKAQKIALGFSIIAIIVIAGLFIYSNQPKNYYSCNTVGLPSDIVLYYGDTCPHCKIVEQFMQENNILQKINITQKEVFENQTNGFELIQVGNSCSLPTNYKGAVPLLYIEGKAYIGDKNIIDILKQKTGVK